MTSVPHYPVYFTFLEAIFTFLISPLSLTITLTRFLHTQKKDYSTFLILSVGSGPILISWFLIFLLRNFSDLSSWIYILIINVIFITPLLLFPSGIIESWQSVKAFVEEVILDLKESKFYWFAYSVSFLILFTMFFLSIFLPFIANDPTEYIVLGKIIYTHKSVDMYPLVSGGNYGGFIAPFTHPLAYSGLISWIYFIQGSSEYFGLIRILSPFFGFATFFLLLCLLRKNNKLIAILAGILFLTTPVFFDGVIQHEIDAVRIYAFFAFFMFIPYALQNPSWRTSIMSGLFLGLCLYTHSLGVLAIPIFLVVFFFHKQHVSMGQKIFLFLSALAVGLAFVFSQYLANYKILGHIIHDMTKVRAIRSLLDKKTGLINAALFSYKEKWLNGALDLFYHYAWYGLGYVILCGSVFLLNKKWLDNLWKEKGISTSNYKDTLISVSFLAGISYMGMIFLSVMLNRVDFVINYRYMISAQPLICIAAAWTVIGIYNKYLKRPKDTILKILLVALIVISINIAIPITTNEIIQAGLSPSTLKDDDLTKGIYDMPLFQAINDYNSIAQDHDKVFTFTNGQMSYYANTPNVYKTDTRLIPLYYSGNKLFLSSYLHLLGITYVIIPGFSQSFLTYSHLRTLFADPKYTELLSDHSGTQLAKLYKIPLDYTREPVTIPSLDRWSTNTGKKKIARDGGIEASHPFNHRYETTMFYSGNANQNIIPTEDKDKVAIQSNQHYRIKVELSGRGLFWWSMGEYKNGQLAKLTQITPMFTLVNPHKATILSQQFISDSWIGENRLVFSFHGPGTVHIKKVTLERIDYLHSSKELTEYNDNKMNFMKMGWEVYQVPWYLNQTLLLSHRYEMTTHFIKGMTQNILLFVKSTSYGFHDARSTLSVNVNNTFKDAEYLPLRSQNTFFSDWYVKKRSNNLSFIALSPADSQKYLINSPQKPFLLEKSQLATFSIYGKGKLTLELHGITKNGTDYPLLEKEVYPLSENIQKITIQLSKEKIDPWLLKMNTFQKMYFQISYKRPNHHTRGKLRMTDFEWTPQNKSNLT